MFAGRSLNGAGSGIGGFPTAKIWRIEMTEKRSESGGDQGKPDIKAEVDLLLQKDKLPGDETAHAGNKPEAAGDGGSMHETGQGQGQSAGKPQTQPQE
jgi:hypothetical protein